MKQEVEDFVKVADEFYMFLGTKPVLTDAEAEVIVSKLNSLTFQFEVLQSIPR